MLRFFGGVYAAGHWVNKPEPEFLIKKLKYINEGQILDIDVKLNPTDMRCYRLLVICSNPDVMNRPLTGAEYKAILTMTAEVVEKVDPFSRGLVPQVEMAANNAMSVGEDGVMELGSAKEPFRLHTHVMFRGIEGEEHIPGVPYHGPKAGELFNMRDGKVKWDSEQLKLAMEFFKSVM